jgi:hypothetical protein
MTISAEFVQDAEAQLLELVRGEDVSGFSVTIVCANDKWIISTTDNESGAYCIGEGPTFAHAWHAIPTETAIDGANAVTPNRIGSKKR